MDKTIRIFQFILMIIFLMFQNIIKIGLYCYTKVETVSDSLIKSNY